MNDRPRYFVGILDDVVQTGVDEGGEPRAIVGSTDPDVRDWAEEVFERYRQQATQLELPNGELSPGGSGCERPVEDDTGSAASRRRVAATTFIRD